MLAKNVVGRSIVLLEAKRYSSFSVYHRHFAIIFFLFILSLSLSSLFMLDIVYVF